LPRALLRTALLHRGRTGASRRPVSRLPHPHGRSVLHSQSDLGTSAPAQASGLRPGGVSALDEVNWARQAGGAVEVPGEYVLGGDVFAGAVVLSRPVVVALDRDDEIVLMGGSALGLALLRRMVPVVDFEAVEAGGDELGHRGFGHD